MRRGYETTRVCDVQNELFCFGGALQSVHLKSFFIGEGSANLD